MPSSIGAIASSSAPGASPACARTPARSAGEVREQAPRRELGADVAEPAAREGGGADGGGEECERGLVLRREPLGRGRVERRRRPAQRRALGGLEAEGGGRFAEPQVPVGVGRGAAVARSAVGEPGSAGAASRPLARSATSWRRHQGCRILQEDEGDSTASSPHPRGSSERRPGRGRWRRHANRTCSKLAGPFPGRNSHGRCGATDRAVPPRPPGRLRRPRLPARHLDAAAPRGSGPPLGEDGRHAVLGDHEARRHRRDRQAARDAS